MTTLTTIEIAEAQSSINETPNGVYELKEIYGPKWEGIAKPKSFGARFKASVLAGDLKHIQIIEPPKTNNHYTYRIERSSFESP